MHYLVLGRSKDRPPQNQQEWETSRRAKMDAKHQMAVDTSFYLSAVNLTSFYSQDRDIVWQYSLLFKSQEVGGLQITTFFLCSQFSTSVFWKTWHTCVFTEGSKLFLHCVIAFTQAPSIFVTFISLFALQALWIHLLWLTTFLHHQFLKWLKKAPRLKTDSRKGARGPSWKVLRESKSLLRLS